MAMTSSPHRIKSASLRADPRTELISRYHGASTSVAALSTGASRCAWPSAACASSGATQTRAILSIATRRLCQEILSMRSSLRLMFDWAETTSIRGCPRNILRNMRIGIHMDIDSRSIISSRSRSSFSRPSLRFVLMQHLLSDGLTLVLPSLAPFCVTVSSTHIYVGWGSFCGRIHAQS